MKIAIVGHGTTGSFVAEFAKARGHELSIVDPHAEVAHHKSLSAQALEGCQIAIDFTSPKSALNNINLLAKYGVGIVMGTTGWYDELEKVRTLVEQQEIGFIYGHNFSIGVSLFYEVVRNAARLINKFEEYDVAGLELHHNHKKDSPSGTAQALTEILLQEITRKTGLISDKLEREPKENELHFASVRCGGIPGTHKIIFDSDVDTITLEHQARNRKGFALGAVLAAEWLEKKKGFYSVNDLTASLFS